MSLGFLSRLRLVYRAIQVVCQQQIMALRFCRIILDTSGHTNDIKSRPDRIDRVCHEVLVQ